MKKPAPKSVSQPPNRDVQLARIRLVKADNAVKSARGQSRLAKEKRKTAKKAARLARKRLKRAKAELAEAKQALAKTEKKVAQARQMVTKTPKNTPARPAQRVAANKSKPARKPVAAAKAKRATPRKSKPGAPQHLPVAQSDGIAVSPSLSVPRDWEVPAASPAPSPMNEEAAPVPPAAPEESH